MLDSAAQHLRDAGFSLPLETGSALLGARLLSGTAEEQRAQRENAIEVARSLFSRMQAEPRLRVGACVHADRAITRPAAAEILGGAIVNIAAWVPQDDDVGLRATREAVDGRAEHSESTRRYVKLH